MGPGGSPAGGPFFFAKVQWVPVPASRHTQAYPWAPTHPTGPLGCVLSALGSRAATRPQAMDPISALTS